MKIVFGAGGTGGHIIPAIAVAKELETKGWSIYFIGNSGSLEEKIISKHQYCFFPIKVQKLYRKFTLQHLLFPVLFIKSLAKCVIFLLKLNPECVFCTGGYVSAPVALTAILLKKPLFFQDGNSYPGLTTKVFAWFCEKIFIASDSVYSYIRKDKTILIGNPMLEYQKINKADYDVKKLNLSPNALKLFIIGGSQGSEIINKVISESLEVIKEMNIDLIWQTGKKHIDNVIRITQPINGIYCFGFTEHISEFYQISDIAISRAGALSISELEEFKIPALFIPLPNAAENHQLKNAQHQYRKGVCEVLEQRYLSSSSLVSVINKMINNLDYYRKNLEKLPANHATQNIAEIIHSSCKKKEK